MYDEICIEACKKMESDNNFKLNLVSWEDVFNHYKCE